MDLLGLKKHQLLCNTLFLGIYPINLLLSDLLVLMIQPKMRRYKQDDKTADRCEG
jgi:hypothetical protein